MGARRPCLAALLLLATMGVPRAHTEGGAAFTADVEALTALSPRREGSLEERWALAYVRDRLVTAGLTPAAVTYADTALPHSYSSGLELRLPGSGDDTLVIVVAMDQVVDTRPGERGPDLGAALALRLALHVSESHRAVTVRVAFLGAEHGVGADYPLGSRRYLSRFQSEGRTAFLYLDLPETPARLALVTGSGRVGSPRWLVGSVARSLAAVGLPYRLRGNLVQLNRLGLGSTDHPVTTYLRAGYPALALTAEARGRTITGAPPDPETFAAALESALDGVLRELEAGVPTEWDRHYLTVQVGQTLVVVPERLYVVLLGGLTAFCLLFAAFSGRRGRRYAVALARGSWSIPLHLALLFLFALVPTLILEALLSGFGFPTLWRSAPVELGILKVLLSGSLFALLTPLATRTVLPRGDTFYSAASVVLQALSLVAVSLYDVSLAVYFAWGLLFLLLATLARGRVLKIALVALAPVWTARALVEMFWLGQMDLIRWVLLDRLLGSLILAGVAAPYYFMALRLRLLLPARHHRLRRGLIAAAGLLLIMAATAMAALVAYQRPYQGGAARPITAQAVYDFDTGGGELILECPIAIGDAVVWASGRSTAVSTKSRQARLDLEPPSAPLAFQAAGTPFLNRRNVVVTLAPSGPESPWPYRLSLRLRSPGEFVVFDASLPFERQPGGLEYVISVGAGPPYPLVFEITLPQGLELALVVEARYLELPSQLRVEAAGAVIEPSLLVRITYPFAT